MGRNKFIIGGIIVLAAILYLAYTGFAGSATYYYTVSEALDRKAVSGSVIRVSGEVSEIAEKSGGLTLNFVISEQGVSLPVAYHGAVPDTFKLGGEVVVEGRLGPDGVFEADTIITKCPSKYQPRE